MTGGREHVKGAGDPKITGPFHVQGLP